MDPSVGNGSTWDSHNGNLTSAGGECRSGHAEGEMIMDDADPLTDVKASLALSDLKRRERLLKIIRGKPEWIYYTAVVILLIIIIFSGTEAAFILIPLVCFFALTWVDFNRRMNALIELIGEESLRKPETDDEE